ncbi:peptide-methionine (R)-S-oxide reductase MsrB [Sphingomonas rhizophila]|uniref:peptide-methionine (R)-S-oxide reductase n=1 Tax=Sphingomonas rhizophila TaxID=2071607 RepID=A0A7G9SCK2_9SPHN|nr:peptide-methionine (R)-S-oxide reductase MsrB [Sphingomonas rhizophila]QNN65577.1 peptide-methionine (R)-S-oxide reductase MsrB [Sphingomonas rhizophila]
MISFDRRALLGAGFAGIAMAALAISRSPADAGTGSYKLTPAQWRRKLGDQRFRILREQGTERAWTSPLLKEKRKGVFACAGCGLPLFSSAAKYDSGTGWPSFWQALPNAIGTRRDTSLFMDRVEEHCRRCGGHLGHIFDDGPRPTGKRHCINGLSLIFRPA